jgi:hypothetical protein
VLSANIDVYCFDDQKKENQVFEVWLEVKIAKMPCFVLCLHFCSSAHRHYSTKRLYQIGTIGLQLSVDDIAYADDKLQHPHCEVS